MSGHDFTSGQYCRDCDARMGSPDGLKPCKGKPPWDKTRVARVVGFDPTTGEETLEEPEPGPAGGYRVTIYKGEDQLEAPDFTGPAMAKFEEAVVAEIRNRAGFDPAGKVTHTSDIDTGSAVARRHDPETSKAAARKLKTGSLNARIVAALKEHGPMTIKEISETLHEEQITVSPRIKPLRRAGYLRNSGEKRINFGSNAEATVWAAGAEPEPLEASRSTLREQLRQAQRETAEWKTIAEAAQRDAATRAAELLERTTTLQGVIDGLRHELGLSERSRRTTQNLIRRNDQSGQ